MAQQLQQIDTAHNDLIVRRAGAERGEIVQVASPRRGRSVPPSSLTALALNAQHHLPPTQHDAQFDFYGKRVATCSSDRVVKVFDVVAGASGDEYAPSAEIAGCGEITNF